jgi:hypothetical protein
MTVDSISHALNRVTSELEKRQEQLLEARKLSSIDILTSSVAHQLKEEFLDSAKACVL